MNNNANGNLYQQQQPSYSGSSGINPAVLAAFQNQNAKQSKYPSGGGGGGAVNPAQLINGMGMGMGIGGGPQHQQQHSSSSGMGINPAQLLQQRQQFMNDGMGGGGMAMGMSSNNMMMGGINPAALSSSPSSSGPPPPSQIHPPPSPSPSAHPNSNPHPHPGGQSLAQLFNMTPAQFNALPPHEKQQKMMYAASQQQQAAMREQFREKQLMQQAQAEAQAQARMQAAQHQHGGGGGGMMGGGHMSGGGGSSGGGMGGQQRQSFHPGQGMMGVQPPPPPQQHQFRGGGGDQGLGGMSMNTGMNMGGMNPNMNMNIGGMGGGMGPTQQQFREQILQGHSSPQPPQQMMNNMGIAMNSMSVGGGGGGGGMGLGSSGGLGGMGGMGMGGGGMYANHQNQDPLQGLMGGPGPAPRAPSAMSGGGSFYDRPLSSASGGGQPPHTPQQPHQQPSQGQGGMMLPPSGIPRGGGGGGMGGMGPGGMGSGMGGMGGLGMGMNFNTNPNAANMGMGMRSVSGGGGGGMRPPSRAMSATPVNGVNGYDKQRGMSPSQNLSHGGGGGANPYPGQAGYGQQGQYAHSPSGHQQQQHQQQHQLQHQQPQLPQTPQQQQQQNQPQPHPRSTPTPVQMPTSASPPLPGSPYRGAKRKVGGDGSPRSATVGMGMGGMGPPSSINVNGTAAGAGTGYSAPQTPRPLSSLGMNGVTSTSGMGAMTTEMPSRPSTQQGHSQGQQQQQQQLGQQQQGHGQGHHQRQSSLTRQGSLPVMPKAESVPPVELPTPVSAPASAPAPPTAVAAAASAISAPAPAPTAVLTAGSSTTAPETAKAAAAAPTAPTRPASSANLSAPAPTAMPSSSTPYTTAPAVTAAAATTSTPKIVPHLPPLPANVSLNPSVTRVTVVPLLTSLSTIPALSEDETADVKGWMEKDREYEGVWRGMKERMGREGREALWKGTAWWEKGFAGAGQGQGQGQGRRREVFDVRYPRVRREPGREGRGRRGLRREGLRLPRKLDKEDVNRPEQLVPIRLEFDVEHHKMRDTFVWNLNDPVVTPEHFAQTVVEDYNLSASYHAVITKSIQDQLSDFKAHSGLYDVDGAESSSPVFVTNSSGTDVGPKRGRLEGEEERWWDGWRERVGAVQRSRSKRRGKKRRKIVKEEDGGDADVEDVDMVEGVGDVELGWDKPMSLAEMEIDEAKMHEEMRILVKLDIIVGSMKLDDQFEWDLDSEHASPEDFAEVYTQELGLSGEFKTAIAHSIREQVQTYQKSLFLVGHPSDGTAVQDDDLRLSFLPNLTSAARPLDQVQSYTPLLNYLSDGEIDRIEKERDKDMNKRRKRNTRGRRGIALPDREPIRTYRTPAIGFPELDPATLALAAAANAPMSRRAAAAAASLTIANMVASENGTAFLPQVAVPSAAVPPPVPKDKKTAKGHFKAPPYDTESVLRPRAKVTAPTPSTAADVSKLPAPLENDPPPPVVSSSVVMGAAAPPDSKVAKVITAKRAKELEREAKEKEFADGQHPNMIDGVWHCSNCGCPDSIAVGRRKGPLGDKSQCGICGKYWHRHRRPRPVEYNSDPDFHNGLKRELEVAKITASQKKKGGAAALRAQGSTVPPTPAETSEAQTPSRSNGDMDASARQSPAPMIGDDDRAISPVSTASSASEPPLAQRIKLNGSNSHRRQSTPPPPVTPTLAAASTTKPDVSPSKTPVTKASDVTTSPTSPARPLAAPPQWLSSAKAAMMARYPNDKFEIILRKVNASSSPEWRIKCLDCPGKLYTPGPGETLANYEVHLKNRQHRQRVNDRLNNGTDS